MVGDAVASAMSYGDADPGMVCVFIDGPKGQLALRLAERLLELNPQRYGNRV